MAMAIVQAAKNIKHPAIDLKQTLWSKSAAEEGRVLAAMTSLVVRLELRKGMHGTPSNLPNSTWLLDVNDYIPQNCGYKSGHTNVLQGICYGNWY